MISRLRIFGFVLGMLLLAVAMLPNALALVFGDRSNLANAQGSIRFEIDETASQSAFDCRRTDIDESVIVVAWNEINETETGRITLTYDLSSDGSLPYCQPASTELRSRLDLRLHSPAFEITPEEAVFLEQGTETPISQSWLATPMAPGSHELILEMRGALHGFHPNSNIGNFPDWEPLILGTTTLSIPVEVLTSLGLSVRVERYARAALSIVGFVLSLPFLLKLVAWLRRKEPKKEQED